MRVCKLIVFSVLFLSLIISVSAINFGTGASFISITGNAVKTLPSIKYNKAPASWEFIVKEGSKVEVTTYPADKKSNIDAYGGWSAYLKVNGKKVWKNDAKYATDFLKNKKYSHGKGKGKWVDVTKLIRKGGNKVTFYHYNEGPGIGIKLRITEGKPKAAPTPKPAPKPTTAPEKPVPKPATHTPKPAPIQKDDSYQKKPTPTKAYEKEKTALEKAKEDAREKAKEERYQKHLAEKKRLEELRKPKKICSPAWKCREKNGKSYREYQEKDCSWGGVIVICEKGCDGVLGQRTNRICVEEIEEDRAKKRAESDRKRQEAELRQEEEERARRKAVETPKPVPRTCTAMYICKYHESNKAYIESYQDKNCNVQPIRICKHGCLNSKCAPAPKPIPLPPMEMSKDVEYIRGETVKICREEKKCEGKNIVKIAKDCEKTVVKKCDQQCSNGVCKCISSYFCLDSRTSARRGTDCQINKKISCESGCNQEIGLCFEKPKIWCDSKDDKKVLIKDKHGNTREKYCKSNEKCSNGKCVKKCNTGWTCEKGFEVYYNDYCRATKRNSCGNMACNVRTGRCSKPKVTTKTCKPYYKCERLSLVYVDKNCKEEALKVCNKGCKDGKCIEDVKPKPAPKPTPRVPAYTPPTAPPSRNYCMHGSNRYNIGTSICTKEGDIDYQQTCSRDGHWLGRNCPRGCRSNKGLCRADWCSRWDTYVVRHKDCV